MRNSSSSSSLSQLSPRRFNPSSPTLTRSPKMGKRVLHRAPHKSSNSSLHSQARTPPPPPPPPPPPLPPPLPPYPSAKCIEPPHKCSAETPPSRSAQLTASPCCDRKRSFGSNCANLADGRTCCPAATDKCCANGDGVRANSTVGDDLDGVSGGCSCREVHPCGTSLLLQAQIQHLLIESYKSTNHLPPLDQLLLDSAKLGISQSELRRILSQHLGQPKRSEPWRIEGANGSGRCSKNGASSAADADLSADGSHDSDLQMAELSMSLDSWKPKLTASEVACSSSGGAGGGANLASSMPELAHQSGASGATSSSYRSRAKGNLSVRFENTADDDDDDDDEEAGVRLEMSNRAGPSSGRHRRRRYRRGDDDSDSCCSTCSSSSSSDDPTVYQLPARRTYAGGARISYVPNDAVAIAKRQQQSLAAKSPSKKPLPDDKNCVIS